MSDLHDQSANWNPVTVPNGPDDMATLRTSNMTLDLCASIKVGGNTYQVNYHGGDGNDLASTVSSP